jgi:hypothetical protein
MGDVIVTERMAPVASSRLQLLALLPLVTHRQEHLAIVCQDSHPDV